MTTNTDAIARAIDNLGAVEVAPGRYAHYADETRRWYIVSESDLADLGERLAVDDDAYSLWCSDTLVVEMPSWWTPERRFAWRIVAAKTISTTSEDFIDRYASAADARKEARFLGGKGTEYERITADLETGAEVPA